MRVISPYIDKDISIHAPARGATMRVIPPYSDKDISIHAPARGATHLIMCNEKSLLYFNPRSREGSDQQS